VVPPPPKPTDVQLRAAVGKSIRDVITPGLDVLFCGINPGLYSAATGCHFARPGNRFWPALHAAGFTTWRLQPWEREAMLAAGIGVTNLVRRATVAADELAPAELRAGARRLAGRSRGFARASSQLSGSARTAPRLIGRARRSAVRRRRSVERWCGSYRIRAA